MNRQQRRASKKSKEGQDSQAESQAQTLSPGLSGARQSSILDDVQTTNLGLNLSNITIPDLNITSPEPATAKPGLIVRLIAKLLLSRWVLNRVSNPSIESLLSTVATQLGRDDVADELARRQALR